LHLGYFTTAIILYTVLFSFCHAAKFNILNFSIFNMALCASFNLPFRFVDEGDYNVPYTCLKRRYFTKVHIKLEQNFTKSKEIGGIGINALLHDPLGF